MADSQRLKFDPTINLGHILTLSGVILTVIGGWWVADYRLAALENQVKNLSTIVVDTARFDERLKSANQRIDRLEGKPPAAR